MRCIHRRGFTLIQALGFLVLLGTVLTLGTMLIAQMAKFNGHENRRQQAEAKMQNLLEHFRRDVRAAGRVGDVEDRNADRLVLYGNEGVVVYQWSAPTMSRTWQPLEGQAVTYAWEWEALTPAFAVEEMNAGAPVVWLRVTRSQWHADTRLTPPCLATAARLGGGSI
jgi:type II secretory pathway component PulJ